MAFNNWEQSNVPADNPDNQGVDDPGQGLQPAAVDNSVSTGMTEESVLALVKRVVGEEIQPIRQDLEQTVERQVQSFSDKAYDRLTKEQRERLSAVDGVMEGLKDALGPDYDTYLRQARLDAITQLPAPEQTTQPPAQNTGTQPQTAPQNPSTDGTSYAEAYASRRLGDPKAWPEQQRVAILNELAQAPSVDAYLDVVDKYAGQRNQQSQGWQPGVGQQSNTGQPAGNTGAATRAARIQPVGGGRQVGGKTVEQLGQEYNEAMAERDPDLIERIGKQLDAALRGS